MKRNRLTARMRADQPKDLPERTLEFVASTNQVASDGKIIRLKAWASSIERIRAGGRIPKVLACHIPAYENGRQPVIGRIPPESIRIEEGVGLVHHIEFATEEVHEEGPKYYASYRDGYMDAVSVGWDDERMAPETDWARDDTPEVDDLDWMETSCVPFGADEGAVKRARSKGQHGVAQLLAALRDAKVAAWEDYAARVKRDGVNLSLDLLRELCTGCADEAINRFGNGVQAITVRELPETLKAGIKSRVATRSFFDTCERTTLHGFSEDESRSFVAWLYRECTGEWPTAREDVAGDDGGEGDEPADNERMIEHEHADCPDDKPYALVSKDGELLGCHASEEEAKEHEQTIKAQAGADDDDDGADDKGSDGAASKHALTAVKNRRNRRARRVRSALSAGELSGRLPDAPNTRTNGAPNTRANIAPTFSQYLEAGEGGLVQPTDAGSHRDALASGGYALVGTMSWPYFGFLPVRADTDNLAVFGGHPAEQVLEEIDRFWDSGERYTKFGLQHRRGLLLHGDPGMGKTGTLNLVRERMAAAGEMVIDATAADPWMLREAMHAIREVEPDRPITVIVEDIERWGHGGESELLALLDGQNSIGRCLVIASTNYRDQMSPRMLRHGRFDLHVEVTPPNIEGRLAYLKLKVGENDVDEALLRKIADDTDGWSYSELREFVTAHFVQEIGVDDAMARINPTASASNNDGGDGEPVAPALVELADEPDYEMERLASAVEMFASDRAEAAQDIRSLCSDINANVASLARAIDGLPQAIAQQIAESLEGQTRSKEPKAPVGAGDAPTSRSNGTAEHNQATSFRSLIGDLKSETDRLTGKASE